MILQTKRFVVLASRSLHPFPLFTNKKCKHNIGETKTNLQIIHWNTVAMPGIF